MSGIEIQQYPKPNPKVPYHNKKLQKLHATQISHTDRLINNFIIHQNLPMTPISLKHLITNDNIGVMDVISLYGRQIIIIVLRYPAFDPKVSNNSYEKKPLTDEVVASYPSYICAIDYQTYDVLDVVPVLGEVKCFTSYREYIAINIAETMGAPESQLITYALTSPTFKFQQIQPAFHIGADRQSIKKIAINYILLPATDTPNSTGLQPQGRLIIYGMSQVQYYGTDTNHDLLLTYNHFRGQDEERWEFHKSALIHGLLVDISKYTHTDIFPARDVEHNLYGEKNKNPMDLKFNNTIHRIVSLSMDNPNIYYHLSELLRPIYKRYLSLSVNDYILHPDGRLELLSQDDKGIPLYSVKAVKQKEPICEYYYPSEKVGLEVIYAAGIINPINPPDGSLVFDGQQVTVKNNTDAYHLQPGNILKYACMKYLLGYEKRKLFSTPGDSHFLKIAINKLFYSPDGKYLAIEIKKYSNYQSETYDLNGVILYSRSTENGRWIETSYISFEKYYGQKRISFRAADNQFGEHLGYNLWITIENRDKFPEFVVIPTVLAHKYNDLLSRVFPDLAQSNINNISKFLANQKTKFIDLQSSVYKDYNNSRSLPGYKHLKLDV